MRIGIVVFLALALSLEGKPVAALGSGYQVLSTGRDPQEFTQRVEAAIDYCRNYQDCLSDPEYDLRGAIRQLETGLNGHKVMIQYDPRQVHGAETSCWGPKPDCLTPGVGGGAWIRWNPETDATLVDLACPVCAGGITLDGNPPVS
jgi:hypothetical protein